MYQQLNGPTTVQLFAQNLHIQNTVSNIGSKFILEDYINNPNIYAIHRYIRISQWRFLMGKYAEQIIKLNEQSKDIIDTEKERMKKSAEIDKAKYEAVENVVVTIINPGLKEIEEDLSSTKFPVKIEKPNMNFHATHNMHVTTRVELSGFDIKNVKCSLIFMMMSIHSDIHVTFGHGTGKNEKTYSVDKFTSEEMTSVGRRFIDGLFTGKFN
jgi:hypothetical protein